MKQHLLIIRFSALGDVAMMVPVVYSLAKQYPELRITVLSRPFARPFFEDLAPNVNFMAADVKGEYHGMKGLNSLYRRLVAKQFTHVADLHSVLRSDYLRLRFLLGHFKVQHINKHRKDRRRLVSPKRKILRPLPAQQSNYMEVFEKLGFPISKLTFKSLFPDDGGNLNLLPKAIGEKRAWEQWIGIAPFAAHQGKVYPPEKMEQVVKALTENYPKCRIFLFGRGKEEDCYFKKWVKEMPQCVFVGWHLENIHQELILMSHLDVMVSMDSANMHLASLTDTPVVSVWGATHPAAGFMGYNQKEENSVQLDLDCRPCSVYGQKPCRFGDYHCMTAIRPETIASKVTDVIERYSITKNSINPKTNNNL